VNSNEKKIDEWLQLVRGKVITKRLRAVYEANHMRWADEPDTMFTENVQMKTEDVYVVEIPERELISMYDVHDWYKRNQGGFPMEKFDDMIRNKHQDEHVRKTNPGVKEAWEKYQTMLQLAK